MKSRSITRVLVANRGEIAVRVIRGCHERGATAVAVYSDADADALHVRLADAAVHIGPPASSSSYLVADKLLEAAAATGCDAVHPGYGFLSENAEFARRVAEAGLVWIGPPPASIAAMGSKTAARKVMRDAGVPVVPGTVDPLVDPEEALRVCADIGFPVMLKASAGGGGKGMRLVHDASGLVRALQAARSEAAKAFGDDAVYVEKAIIRPRHVEIQVLADQHGNVIHLLERDCSIQRRHQKVFEEAPCPVLDADVREQMAVAACNAARAVDYEGVGTVEFLLDADGRNFYFLEMNTRLQVEHPITELITGVDLVQAQLRVAAGEPLWLQQDDIQAHGHAVECRIYAEDAAAGFRPSPGPLLAYREPSGPGVRVDSGVSAGDVVPIHYDPMIAKLAVWGRDREEALARARRALLEYRIVGIPTSIPFFLALLEDEPFRNGVYDTGFIREDWLREEAGRSPYDAKDIAVAAAIAQAELAAPAAAASDGGDGTSMWVRAHRWATMRRGTA